MLKKIIGAIDLFIGILILIWVSYNYLVEMEPAAKGFNPIFPLLFATGAIYFGFRWLNGK